ncbi:hypothetical protein BB560_000408 [Smittium megazygosporum]|uniref:MIF4G domain-containing protein n=1 Tax=Smittium megazygosporum TaxID=133381 RepID=A0A2T9ZKH0_9FUNG|nr:hypothetical protein BB560_000408 [Smittium megazygosporum]
MPPANLSNRLERVLRLRKLNIEAWQGQHDVDEKDLIATMKKNTSFIKKCKSGINPENSAQMIKDVKSLQLSKYLSEIISAVTEGITRISSIQDINATVEVISALHQRFKKSFTPKLIVSIINQLLDSKKTLPAEPVHDSKDKDEISRVSKIKTQLRIFYEMYLSGVLWKIDTNEIALEGIDKTMVSNNTQLFASKSSKLAKPSSTDKQLGYTNLYFVLSEIFSSDLRKANIVAANYFAKVFFKDFGNIKDTGLDNFLSDIFCVEGQTQIITKDQIILIKNLFSDYWGSGCKLLTSLNKLLQKLEKNNKDMLYNKGTLSEERKAKFDNLSKLFIFMKENMENFSEIVGLDMIELSNESDDKAVEVYFDKQNMTDKSTLSSRIWVDEEERQFYTSILDIQLFIPQDFLVSNGLKKSTSPELDVNKELQLGTEKESDAGASLDAEESINNLDNGLENTSQDYEDFILNQKIQIEKKIDSTNAETETLSTDKSEQSKDGLLNNTSPSARLQNVILTLPYLSSREKVDELAVEYVLASVKQSHKKIISALLDIPKKRQEVMPFYSRFIAILNPYFPAIGKSVRDSLDSEFRWLMRNKSRGLINFRMKNAKYISELTKFNIIPQYIVTMYCKRLTESFSNNDIEVLCLFLENCGLLLLSNPESNPHISQILKTLLRKRNALNLDQRTLMLIDNAYLMCNPTLSSENKAADKERTWFEKYIRYLIYEVLSPISYKYVFKQLRKLPWDSKYLSETSEDKDSQLVHKTLISCFTKPYKVNFDNLPIMAILVELLSRIYPWFGIIVVDLAVEKVKIELENNKFEHNRRRVAIIRYIGELYLSTILDSTEIFDILYLLLNIKKNTSLSTQLPEDIFWNDPNHAPENPDDFFITHLVCDLLTICGPSMISDFDKANVKIFLEFFELYLLTKVRPFSFETRFTIEEAFECVGSKFNDRLDPSEIFLSLNQTISTHEKFFIYKNYMLANQGKDTNVSSEIDNLQSPNDIATNSLESQLLDEKLGAEDLAEDFGTLDIEDGGDDSLDDNVSEISEMIDNFGASTETSDILNDIRKNNNKPESGEYEAEDFLNEVNSDYDESNILDETINFDDENDTDYCRNIAGKKEPVDSNASSVAELQNTLNFENELNNLISESLNNRRQEKMIALDVAIPFQLRDRNRNSDVGKSLIQNNGNKRTNDFKFKSQKTNSSNAQEESDRSKVDDSEPNLIAFSMLLGKKNKPQIKNVYVPDNSELALHTKAQQLVAQQEKAKLNRIVLSYAAQENSVQKNNTLKTAFGASKIVPYRKSVRINKKQTPSTIFED